MKIKYRLYLEKHGLKEVIEFTGRCARTALIRFIDRELKEGANKEWYYKMEIDQINA